MNDTVLLPGSYDPVTAGHLHIIKRCAAMCTAVRVVIFVNPHKQYLFSLEDRLALLRLACKNLPNVTVDSDQGYVVDYARRHGIRLAIKGVRNGEDEAYEQTMADYNRQHGGLETLFLPCHPAYKDISSTALRQALEAKADLSPYLPPHLIEETKRRYRSAR